MTEDDNKVIMEQLACFDLDKLIERLKGIPKTWVIEPQPEVIYSPHGWDISGIFYPCGHSGFMQSAEFYIGNDERFKPPLEMCGGSYGNIRESFVEKIDGKYTWIIVLDDIV